MNPVNVEDPRSMIIAFMGKLGSGKDTAADRLETMLTKEVDRRAFANLLKDSAAASLGVERKLLDENKNNPDAAIQIWIDGLPCHTISIGEYYQLYGTEGHRKQAWPFGEEVWLDGCLPLNEDYSDKFVVVTDCRFVNEADRVHKLGGYVVRVLGPDDLTSETRQAGHASEMEQDQIIPDFTIDNSVRDDGYIALTNQLVWTLNTIDDMLVYSRS